MSCQTVFPFEIILLQTTSNENNWKTEETLERTVVTLETGRIKGSNPWCLWWWFLLCGNLELWWCSLSSENTTSWTIRFSNPCRCKRVPSSSFRPDRQWGPSSVLFNGDVGYFTRVMQLGRDDDHSPPFRAEVKVDVYLYSPYRSSWRGQEQYFISTFSLNLF